MTPNAALRPGEAEALNALLEWGAEPDVVDRYECAKRLVQPFNDLSEALTQADDAWESCEPAEFKKRFGDIVFPLCIDLFTPPTDLPGELKRIAKHGTKHKRLYDFGIYTRHLNVIGGADGVGKTTFAVGLAAAVALGENVLIGTKLISPGNQLPVEYQTAEDDPEILAQKIESFAPGRIGEISQNLIVRRIRRPLFDCSGKTPKPTPEMIALKDIAQDNALIIIDTLAAAVGLDDENGPAMTTIARYFADTAETSGAGFVLLHHVNQAARTGRGRASSIDLRGGSGLPAAARYVGILAELSDSQLSNFGIPADCSSDFFELVATKDSYTRRAAPILFRRDGRGVPGVFDPDTDRLANLAQAIAAALESTGAKITQNELIYRPEGAEARQKIEALTGGKIRRPELAAGVENALACGLIGTVNEPNGGRARNVLEPIA